MGGCVSAAPGGGAELAGPGPAATGAPRQAVLLGQQAGAGDRLPRGGAKPTDERHRQMLLSMSEAPLLHVLTAMSKSQSSDVMEAGCRRMCQLQADGEQGLLAAGAVELVLRAMEMHKDGRSLPMQEAAIRFLANAASSAEGQAKVAGAGGGKAVLRAMSTAAFLEEPKLQELGCCTLRNLAHDHSCNGRSGQVAFQIGVDEGVEVVVQAMRSNEEHPRVQERACAALRLLMLDQANQARVVTSEGVEAMLHAAAQHRADAAVVREVCRALELLAMHHPDCRGFLIEAGVDGALEQCLSDHLGDGAVQAPGQSLLALLRMPPSLPAAGRSRRFSKDSGPVTLPAL